MSSRSDLVFTTSRAEKTRDLIRWEVFLVRVSPMRLGEPTEGQKVKNC